MPNSDTKLSTNSFSDHVYLGNLFMIKASKVTNRIFDKGFYTKLIRWTHTYKWNTLSRTSLGITKRSYATYYNGRINQTFLQKNPIMKAKIDNLVHWKHPMVFGKLCPNCGFIKCGNIRHNFCKFHPHTNKKFSLRKVSHFLFGTTTHGTPVFKSSEKYQKKLYPLSKHDMDGILVKQYNYVAFRKPQNVTKIPRQVDTARTKFLKDPKIQKRLDTWNEDAQASPRGITEN